VENRTAKMRLEITRAAEPARRTANDIQMNLAAELDKIIAWQVTGQQQYRVEYEKIIEQQRHGAEVLQRFAPQLGGDVPKRLALLIDGSNQWHISMANGEFL